MDSKHWWQSKAVWGGIVAAAGAIIDMVKAGAPTPEALMTLIGSIMAIYGRIVAKSTIS